MAPSDNRILLILDVDETLVHASAMSPESKPDFRVGPYGVLKRPHLDAFLSSCDEDFIIAFWSSSGADYLSIVISQILPSRVAVAFAWSRERCGRRYHPDRQELYYVKNLKKVKRLGYDLDRVLIVEDSPEKVQQNYGNVIYVSSFYGDSSDTELLQLEAYLKSLRSLANVRAVEKRGWMNRR